MKTVQEVESVLREMPPQEKWEVARWLLEDLQEKTITSADGNGARAPALPAYSARRRRIFGSKVLPNMVLAARAEESW